MAAPAETLKRTPLHARHAAAGAKLVPFAGWEMPVQYAGIREEHLAVAPRRRRLRRLATWARSRRAARRRSSFLQRLLSNDVAKIAVGGAQYSVLCREDGGVLDDLFTYRLADDRYLTVTNASNHDKDLAWFQQHAAEASTSRSSTATRDYAMLAVQGPHARDARRRARRRRAARRASRTAELDVAGVRVLVCGTGYTGEDGVELLVAARRAPSRSGTRSSRRGAAPVGLAARDTLRLEVCFHLYGNDLMEERGPIEAGLGWCCKEDTGFIGSDAVRAAREAGPRREARPVRPDRPGHRPPGQRGRRRRRGDERHAVAVPRRRHRHGLPARRRSAEPGTEIEIDVRGKPRAAARASASPCTDPRRSTDG